MPTEYEFRIVENSNQLLEWSRGLPMPESRRVVVRRPMTGSRFVNRDGMTIFVGSGNIVCRNADEIRELLTKIQKFVIEQEGADSDADVPQ